MTDLRKAGAWRSFRVQNPVRMGDLGCHVRQNGKYVLAKTSLGWQSVNQILKMTFEGATFLNMTNN
jgi:hypothetical protein